MCYNYRKYHVYLLSSLLASKLGYNPKKQST